MFIINSLHLISVHFWTYLGHGEQIRWIRGRWCAGSLRLAREQSMRSTGFFSRHLSALYNAFLCHRPLHPRSCVLIGRHTSTCSGEQNIESRDMTHLHCNEARIPTVAEGHVTVGGPSGIG